MEQNNRLFVYGIFLNERSRQRYGMTNPEYETVPGFITVGGYIVQAMPIDNSDVRLTGLVVDMDPSKWDDLDRLEGGYDRILVETTSKEMVNMYVRPYRREDYER